MILSNKALRAIDEKKPGIKSKLALALKCSEQSINRFLRENDNNSDLTKVAALQVIREETGLNDAEILEEIKEAEPQK